ncbi:MAG: DNA gyrase subunit A [Clostridia bacterium]
MGEYSTDQKITDTLSENYMPYAMSVIVSRAIPEIDGFKPSHRKILYTMYKMGLLGTSRIKSANIVGQTMKLNPHGDQAIYETMVRLSRGHDALILPFVDSKGNFGKHYSRDMAYAAARYTEAKLEPICNEIFANIDSDTVDFVDNYDSSTKEPRLLPTTFPNILVNSNMGIAVGMASSICSFNLVEVCNTTIELIKNPEHDISSTLIAPDFSTGGSIIFSDKQMRDIYATGRGSFKIRAKYNYDKKANVIEITEIPYTTTIEAIADKIVELVKSGSLKEISYIRDETDLGGMRLVLDLKRGVDYDKLMQKLYKQTSLEDSFGCNFNILIADTPQVFGVREILTEWIAFRTECIRRRLYYDLCKKKDRYHLLEGLRLILLDIDKAVKIVRETEEENAVIPNLMIGFGIDEIQATFIAEIKLRNLNKEYILKKIAETNDLVNDIKNIEETLASKAKVRNIIIKELTTISKKYGKPRRTDIISEHEVEEYVEQENIEDYPVNLFITKSGYLKKITPLSLRMGGEQKLKEGDKISQSLSITNRTELLFFTDKCQVYKAKMSDFADVKASVMGDFVATILEFEENENLLFVAATTDYVGSIIIAFKTGRVSKVPLSSYETKTNRKKLINAFSAKDEAVMFFQIIEDINIALYATNGKVLVLNTALVAPKSTKSTQGIKALTMRGKNYLEKAEALEEDTFCNADYYKTKNIPAVGSFLRAEDKQKEQIVLDI